jgi:hypothetical protein
MTESNLTETMAAPCKDERIIRLKELPMVIPNPLSSGSHTNLPYEGVLLTSTFFGFISDCQFMNIMSFEVIVYLQTILVFELTFHTATQVTFSM